MSVVLCVAAHPDDECFMGALLARFSAEGHAVYVLALADGETSRIGAGIKAVLDREFKQAEAAKALGCQVLKGARFPDQRLDRVDVLDITQYIEEAIAYVRPEVVYTHSPGDLNSDHRRVYEAVLPAVRPKNGVREVYCFEGSRMMRPFNPAAFWAITEAQLEQQIAAMRCYGDELSAETDLVRARAIEYGYRVGRPYAAGCETVRVCR